MAYNELLLVDSRSVLLIYYFAVESPRYCSGEIKRRNTVRYGYWKSLHHSNLT
jgi:hypothetical protein